MAQPQVEHARLNEPENKQTDIEHTDHLFCTVFDDIL